MAGIIKECAVYSDSLYTEYIEQISSHIIGKSFTADTMEEVLHEMPVDENTKVIQEDIITLIREEF